MQASLAANAWTHPHRRKLLETVGWRTRNGARLDIRFGRPNSNGVRSSIHQTRDTWTNPRTLSTPVQITCTNHSPQMLIANSFKVRFYQLIGPGWLADQRFDVTANYPIGTKRQEVDQMMQTLLIRRFKLMFHRESREMPVYAILVGRTRPNSGSPVCSERHDATARVARSERMVFCLHPRLA